MATEELAKKSKEKFYRGKNVATLASIDTREFAKLVKARARRAILRNYDTIEQFIRRCDKKLEKNKPIRTHDRALVIVPGLLGKNIGIHNGKEFVNVKIVEEMLGHRLGEFSQTRKIAKHTTIGKKAPKKP